MNKIETRNIKNKIKSNEIAKFFTSLTTWLLAIVFLALIGFIIWQSVEGFRAYGFKGIFLSSEFLTGNLEAQQASIWLPLSVTIIITVGSLLLATPLALKTATFIYFRVKSENIKKAFKIIIEISAAIPSVVFGLFAYKSLGVVVKSVFGLEIPNTVLTTIFMLTFMLVPTIALLTLNALTGVEDSLLINSMSLANSKTKAIYKIVRVQTRKQVVVAIIIAAGRAIGETMAVSMILSSENYSDVFAGGFLEILTSSLRPLGAVISKGMFAENGGAEFRGLLFAFGVVLFVLVMILNSIVMAASNLKNNKMFWWWNIAVNKIGSFFLLIPSQINMVLYKVFYKPKHKVTVDNYQKEAPLFIQERIQKNKTIHFYSIYKRALEWLAMFIVFGVVSWLLLDIVIKGLYAASLPTSTLFSYTKNTTGQAVVNTLLLILIILIISLPISLFIAIWLNEYSKDGLTKKSILFFIDSIGATPSIIFGMFGLTLFIEVLGISAGGKVGNSLLAGALTMVIVILPTFTRMNQQALQSVPDDIRINGYALGNSKWHVIKTLVLPQAYRGILSSSILTIGRIVAETAPLFLTAGLSSSSTIALMNPSQTLTTRIYAQLNGVSTSASTNIMYESALIAIVLILFMILLSYLIIPNWSNIKSFIRERIEIQKMLWKQEKVEIQIETYKTQIQNKVLYLTTEQAQKT